MHTEWICVLCLTLCRNFVPGCYALSVQTDLPQVRFGSAAELRTCFEHRNAGSSAVSASCCSLTLHLKCWCRLRRCWQLCFGVGWHEGWHQASPISLCCCFPQHIEDILENRGIKWRLPD